MRRSNVHSDSVRNEHGGKVAVTQSNSIGRDNLEDRLDVSRRSGDHAKNLARRGLSLQRLLRLVEQPDIFDSNNGLVGKGLQQLDCVSVNGIASTRTTLMTPIATSPRIMRRVGSGFDVSLTQFSYCYAIARVPLA